MSTKVILKRVAIRISDSDENGKLYFEDYKRKGKVIFYPFAQNKRDRICVYVK